MMDLGREDARIVDRLMSEHGAKRVGKTKIKFRCPLHDESTASADWDSGIHGGGCFGCNDSWNVKRMLEILGMAPENSGNGGTQPVEVDRYTYKAPDGNGGWRIAYQVRKFRPGFNGDDKSTPPYHPCPESTDADGFRIGMGGNGCSCLKVERVLYGLRELAEADPARWVLHPEGEGDVETLRKVEFIAVTTMGGCGWKPTAEEARRVLGPLKRRKVCLFADNDDAGREYVIRWARHYLESGAAEVRIVHPAEHVDLCKREDITDAVRNGTKKEDIQAWIKAAPALILEDLKPDDGGIAQEETVPAELKAPGLRPFIPFKPFPLEALPGALREFVKAGAKAKCVDPTFYAVPSIPVLAAAVGMRRRLRVKESWVIPPIVWTTLVADSGTMKTEPFVHAIRPFSQRDFTNSQDYQAAIKIHQVKMAAYDKELQEQKRGRASGEPPVEPPSPIEKALTVGDCTREEVSLKLKDNPAGLLLPRDEIQQFMDSWNVYKGGKGGDAAFWRKCWDGNPDTVDRVKDRKKGRIIVPHMAVSIAGTIQPDALKRRLTPELFEDGTVSRFLWGAPPDREYEWSDDDIPPSAFDTLAELYEKLLALSFLNDTPKDIPLTKDAEGVFKEFVVDIARRGQEEDQKIRAGLAKLRSYPGRIGLPFQCAYDIDRGPAGPEAVGVAAISNAIKIVDFFENEMRRVYALMDEDPLEGQDRKMVELITRLQGKADFEAGAAGKGHITPRHIMQNYRPFRGKDGAGKAKAACNRLVDRGVAVWGPEQRGTKGGRPSRAIKLLEPGPVEAWREDE